MKKIFVIGIAALFVLAGAGCSQKAGAQSGGGSAGKALAKSLETALAGEADAFIEALQKASPAAIAALPAPPTQDFSYDLNKAGDGVVIIKYTGTNPVLIIPAEIDGYPVVEIGRHAFSGAYTRSGDSFASQTKVPLTVVVVAENVKVISWGAFVLQKNLKSVILPASITTIEHEAFWGCAELNSLSLPESVTALDFPGAYEGATSNAFTGCQQLPLAMRKRLQDMGYKGEI